MRKISDSVVRELMLAGVLLALVMVLRGSASWLEAFVFVTGAVCVWLTVKESTWNFPVSLVNVAACFVLLFQSQLYADASLQILFFVLTAIGWYLWIFGGAKHMPLKVSLVDPRAHSWVIAGMTALALVLWGALHAINGTATFGDALVTALSVGAQVLLNYKRLENWLWWILADIVSIPLYLYKSLYLMALLYCVFLVMATMGYLQWRRTWQKQQATAAGGSDGPTVGLAEVVA
jgi:nicotinamide mononucleotide transporter